MRYYEDYRQYESFRTMDDLNESVRLHIDNKRDYLNDRSIEVLFHLSKYSCVVKGVSWLKRATIAGHLGVSEKTITRSMKRLEENGIIQRVSTIRKRGGRGYDIVIIRPVSDQVSRRVPSQSPRHDKPSLELEQVETTNNHNDYVAEPSLNELDASYTPSNIPEDFVKAAAPFFRAKEITALWKRVSIAYNKNAVDAPLYELTGEVINVFKTSVFAYKNGSIRKSFFAYFYKSMEKTFDKVYNRELVQLFEAEGLSMPSGEDLEERFMIAF